MDKDRREQLCRAGIDVDEVLERFMGNEELMMNFLGRFPQDENFQKFLQAMQAGDAKLAYEACHALKGVAGNLSMKELFRQASLVVDCLRGGDLAGARETMAGLEQAYRLVTQALAEQPA